MASDNRGTVYLSMSNGDVHGLWRIGWDDRHFEKLQLPSAGILYFPLMRGDNGLVYGFVRAFRPERVETLMRFGSGGREEKQWELVRGDVSRPYVEDVIGVDALCRLYVFDSIPIYDTSSAPPEAWGYYIYCYSLGDGGLQLLGRAEIRYSKGDMAGEPEVVDLGPGPRMSVGPDGSVVLRAATTGQFKLKFYSPPPWGS